MGLIGTLIEFLRTVVEGEPVVDIKLDQGGDDNLTGELYQPAGFDAQALPGDLVLAVRLPGEQRFAVIGFLDPANEGTAEPGESRMYARDANGAITGTIRIQSDGTVNLGDDVAAELMARADRVEAQLDDIAQAFNGHVHTVPSGSSAGPTGGPEKPAATAISYTPGPTGADKVRGT